MKIIRAKILGYCMGVRRAVELAENALAVNAKVFSLGPLIHNEAALSDLEKRGLFVLKENQIDDLSSMHATAHIAADRSIATRVATRVAIRIVIRAHGVPPKTEKLLKERGFELVDATCPLVKRSQKIAAEYAEKGWTVILAGDRNHGEVTGIAGYAGDNFVLVQNADEAKEFVDDGRAESAKNDVGGGRTLGADSFAKCGAVISETFAMSTSDVMPTNAAPLSAVLLAQTTFSKTEFEKIENILRKKYETLRVVNTICPATKERQDALTELAPQVDGVLVIGGKNSANTARLFASAKKLCTRAALIENADDIPDDFFSLERVGITAGASAPDSVICAVEQRLSSK